MADCVTREPKVTAVSCMLCLGKLGHSVGFIFVRQLITEVWNPELEVVLLLLYEAVAEARGILRAPPGQRAQKRGFRMRESITA